MSAATPKEGVALSLPLLLLQRSTAATAMKARERKEGVGAIIAIAVVANMTLLLWSVVVATVLP